MFVQGMHLALLLATAGCSAALSLLGGLGTGGQAARRAGARVAVTGASGLIGAKVRLTSNQEPVSPH